MACFYTSADALVERDGRFLMVKEGKKHARGTWTLPGGGVEHGENPVEAVKREVKEETGLEAVEVKGMLCSCTGSNSRDGHPVNVYVFLVEVEDGEPEPELAEEILDAEFKGREEIDDLELRHDIVWKALESLDEGYLLPADAFRSYSHPYMEQEPEG